jgi:hypothetical protein
LCIYDAALEFLGAEWFDSKLKMNSNPFENSFEKHRKRKGFPLPSSFFSPYPAC